MFKTIKHNIIKHLNILKLRTRTFLKKFLIKIGYNIIYDKGNNNIGYNLLEFIFLLIYTILSSLNIVESISSSSVSLIMYGMNLIVLLKIFFDNQIQFNDIKNDYIENNKNLLASDLYIRSAVFRTYLEAMTCIIFLIIILLSFFNNHVLYLYIIICFSIITLLCSFFEGCIAIAQNLFKAKPKMYNEIKEKEVC